MMVEQADTRAFVVEAIDGKSRFDQGPASVAIGRAGTGLTAEEQDRAGSGQREQLVMVPLEARFTTLRAEIPRGVPIGRSQRETSFTRNGRFDPLVERCVIVQTVTAVRPSPIWSSFAPSF